MVLAPTAGDRGQTVFLDPGHGAPDPGAIGVAASGQRFAEKDLTLQVALDAAGRLQARGYRVALSRVGDDVGVRLGPDDLANGALTGTGQRAQLSARVQCANLAGADALVSIHFNSFDDPDARGTETLYEPDRSFGASNSRLASLLQRNITRGYAELGRPMPDRGVLGGSGAGSAVAGDLVILEPSGPDAVGKEPSSMPGAVIEPLFMSNPADVGLAASPPGRESVARAITAGVDEFLGSP